MTITLKQFIAPTSFLVIGMLLFLILSMAPFSIPAPISFSSLVMCFVLLGISMVFVHKEGLRLEDVNLWPDMHTPARLALGFGIGAFIVGIMLLAVFNLTDLDYETVTGQSPLFFFVSSLVIIPLALMEEILFRGYPFFRIMATKHIRIGIIFTAVLFGLYHLNDQTSLINVLLGPGIWGVVYGVAAYLSKSVAVPLGIHVAANFMQGIFGMNQHVDSMLMIKIGESGNAFMDVEVLGVGMQCVLLITALIILERDLRSKEQVKAN